jgi:hypothetical protein
MADDQRRAQPEILRPPAWGGLADAVRDQVAGLGAVLVPGTVRDSLYVLDCLLNLDGRRLIGSARFRTPARSRTTPTPTTTTRCPRATTPPPGLRPLPLNTVPGFLRPPPGRSRSAWPS